MVVRKPKCDEDEFSTFHCDIFVMSDIVELFLQEWKIVGILWKFADFRFKFIQFILETNVTGRLTLKIMHQNVGP